MYACLFFINFLRGENINFQFSNYHSQSNAFPSELVSPDIKPYVDSQVKIAKGKELLGIC